MGRLSSIGLASGISVAMACSGSSGGLGPAYSTGASCSQPSECYAPIDGAAVHGQVTCLAQLQSGYCTHTCQSDADCCAVPGECLSGFRQVCASFESTGRTYCFLGCDPTDIASGPEAPITDPTAYCQQWGNAAFTCRSTGGGHANRKFCGP
jgi:hypothetical protein